jgi:hypothetical protein
MPLLDTATVSLSIAPGGYAGAVQLSTTGLPSGVTSSFDSATVTLDGSTAATAVLTLTTATDAALGTAGFDIAVTADGMATTASVALTVQPMITLHIPAGVNSTGATVEDPDTTAYGPYPIAIVAPNISTSSPVTVYFKNDDKVSHEIHADDQAQGFGHDPGPFGAGQMDPYVRQVNSIGTYDFYLHDQGQPITIGRVTIKAAP